jgi:DNA-binding NtrC family response regulator
VLKSGPPGAGITRQLADARTDAALAGGWSDEVMIVSIAPQLAKAAEPVMCSMVGRTIAEVERDLILETLKHCLGNRTHAAKTLGVSLRTIRNKINEYAAAGVSVPPYKTKATVEGVPLLRPS